MASSGRLRFGSGSGQTRLRTPKSKPPLRCMLSTLHTGSCSRQTGRQAGKLVVEDGYYVSKVQRGERKTRRNYRKKLIVVYRGYGNLYQVGSLLQPNQPSRQPITISAARDATNQNQFSAADGAERLRSDLFCFPRPTGFNCIGFLRCGFIQGCDRAGAGKGRGRSGVGGGNNMCAHLILFDRQSAGLQHRPNLAWLTKQIAHPMRCPLQDNMDHCDLKAGGELNLFYLGGIWQHARASDLVSEFSIIEKTTSLKTSFVFRC
ncbi:hypothetical protein RRG08_041884 [Elysia crispata]|uniref:Uncharacterized protein n=1 Tax=Elysia crispata TaxID=231223 RepID=A0AAE1CQN6_9GAST|nr:hypothetical protein RRG08_041884 [Elysia crispata]